MAKSIQPNAFGAKIRHQYPWLPIAIILAIATCLFAFRLGHEGVWIDELFSIRDSSGGPIEAYNGSRKRPLYYVLLSVWMQFGQSDAWLRSLSVIFAIVSVFLIYKLGKRIAGENEGLIAAALLATSPLFINHAQEIRMYALSLCMGLAGSLFLANALLITKPNKPSQKTLAGWAVFRLLAIWAVPLNLTLLIPDVLLIFWRFRQERGVLLSFGKWLTLMLLLWIPPVIAPLLKTVDPASGYAKERTEFAEAPGLGNLIYPLKFWMVWPYVTKGRPVADIFYKLFTLPVAGLVGAGLIHKRKSPALPWALVWFIIPTLPIIAFSLISARIWEPRYVLFVSPYLFILMAAGFTRLWKDWRKAAIVLTAIYMLGMGGALADYYTAQNRGDYRFNIDTIEQYEQPGDNIVWSYGWKEALGHYYEGNSPVAWLSGRKVETSEDLETWIEAFPEGYDRTWLVVEELKPNEMDIFKPKKEELENALTGHYEIVETFEYGHKSAVYLLTPLETASKK